MLLYSAGVSLQPPQFCQLGCRSWQVVCTPRCPGAQSIHSTSDGGGEGRVRHTAHGTKNMSAYVQWSLGVSSVSRHRDV